jgi:hypothetical protein
MSRNKTKAFVIMPENERVQNESVATSAGHRLSWDQRFPLIPISGLIILGVLIVVFGLWRTPTVVANVWDAWNHPSANQSLAKEGSLVLSIVYLTGLTMIGLGCRTLRWFRSQMAVMEQFPNQPWMYRRNWREKKIVLTNRSALVIAIAGTPLLLVVLPFLIFWLPFLRILWLNRHWNRSQLELITLPGRIGGQFEATVFIPAVKPLPAELRVVLQCVCLSRRTTAPDEVLWKTSRKLAVRDCLTGNSENSDNQSSGDIGEHLRVPVSFQIPEEGPLPFNARRRIFWQLIVRPEEKIPMQEAWFEVPVY